MSTEHYHEPWQMLPAPNPDEQTYCGACGAKVALGANRWNEPIWVTRESA